MFIYSFKFKKLRITGWIMLIIILVFGIYFMFQTEGEFVPIEESVEAWQV